MSTEDEIIIKDACILFDLLDLNLMKDFYLLGLTAYTTPQVIAEITEDDQLIEVTKYIDSGKLRVDATASYDEIRILAQTYPNLSIADSSVLELALRKNCPLLTCDSVLRKISTKKELTVRGMLWIIEQLYITENITLDEALHKLNRYSTVNSRAPKKEITLLIQKIQLNL